MDFSSCINFDEIEQKQAKFSIKRNHKTLFSSTHIESPPIKCQTLQVNGKLTEDNSLFSNPLYLKIQKNHPLKTSLKNPRFFAFEGNNLILASLKSLISFESANSKNSRNLSPVNNKANKIIFRRAKLSPGNRPQSCGEVHDFFSYTHQKKFFRNIRAVKRELIPQTKAKNSKNAGRLKTELRINGVMKEFFYRENSVKYRDSAEMIEIDS